MSDEMDHFSEDLRGPASEEKQRPECRVPAYAGDSEYEAEGAPFRGVLAVFWHGSHKNQVPRLRSVQ